MSTEKYNLYYFGVPGRAGPIKLLLHVADVEYDMVTLTKEKFVELKQSGFLPFGKVPLLTKGDFKLAESAAIGNYIARKYGLWPKTEEDSAVATSILSAIGDYAMLFFQVATAKPEEKEEKLKEAKEKFAQFENGVSKLLGEKEFFFEDRMTDVDISLFYFFHALVQKDNLTKENLIKFYDNMKSNKKIAEFLSQ